MPVPAVRSRLRSLWTDGSARWGGAGGLSAAALATGLGGAFWLRVRLAGPESEGPILLAMLQHDGQIFGGLLVAYAVVVLLDRAGGPSRRAAPVLGTAIRLAMVLVSVVYVADVLAFRFFHTRLYLRDVLEFAREQASIRSLAAAGLETLARKPVWKLALLLGMGVLGAASATTFLLSRHRAPARWVGVAGVAGVSLLVFRGVELPPYVYGFNKGVYENVIERNANVSQGRRYSAGFRARLLDRVRPDSICVPGAATRLDLVLVLVEGLSMYHSAAFSGVQDFTPQFDRMARQGRMFTEFFANGWTTRGVLLATLGETIPVVREGAGRNVWGSPAFEDFRVMRSVPETLRRAGYHTMFLTTGDLSFTSKGAWLASIGFDSIEGHTAPDYAGLPRSSFRAVSDSALYLRALRALRERADSPIALVLETVSGHFPFRSQDGRPDSEENVYRFVDRQLGIFYDSLRAERFFDDGILIVAGDHRASTPMSRREWRRFGRSAVARAPMVVIGRGIEGGEVERRMFQQIDMRPSIEALVGETACRERHQGMFLGPATAPPPFIVHAMGQARELVYVRAPDGEAIVRTDGDHTRAVWGELRNEAAVVDLINYVRIR